MAVELSVCFFVFCFFVFVFVFFFNHAVSSCLYAAVVISVSSVTIYLDCGTCRDVLGITAVYTSVVVEGKLLHVCSSELGDSFAFVIKAF